MKPVGKPTTSRRVQRPQPDKFRTHSEYKRGALACKSERLTDAQRTTDPDKGNSSLGRYTNVAARGPLVFLDLIIRPHGWRGAIERAVILLVIVGVVVGLLMFANRHDLNVYNNIV